MHSTCCTPNRFKAVSSFLALPATSNADLPHRLQEMVAVATSSATNLGHGVKKAVSAFARSAPGNPLHPCKKNGKRSAAAFMFSLTSLGKEGIMEDAATSCK